jgi:ElaB/YqjD/DUF883 family membrane-anchored ribosome-binding protein
MPHEPLGTWPADSGYDSGRYSNAGGSVGTAIGTAMNRARRFPSYMQDRAEDLRRRFRVIRGRAATGELKEDVSERVSEVADETSRQVRLMRSRADYYAHNYPLQFIAGAAATGFVVGFLLRMWRDE